MLTAIGILVTGLFFYDNAEFFDTVKQNQEDGYEWNYIGKTAPDGSPTRLSHPCKSP